VWGWIVIAAVLTLVGIASTAGMVRIARGEPSKKSVNYILALSGVAIAFAVLATVSGTMAVQAATKENNSLIDRVGDDILGGVVTLLPEGEICITINGDDEDKCESRDRFLNLEEKVLGEDPVNPSQYQQVFVAKAKTQGVTGLLLNPDPLPASALPDTPTPTPTEEAEKDENN
jgi:hypothetical protein